MITGSVYVLRGRATCVTCQWHGMSNPDLPRLQALLPLVRLKATAPRNVEIEDPETGLRVVRPFRGLRKAPEAVGSVR